MRFIIIVIIIIVSAAGYFAVEEYRKSADDLQFHVQSQE